MLKTTIRLTTAVTFTMCIALLVSSIWPGAIWALLAGPPVLMILCALMELAWQGENP